MVRNWMDVESELIFPSPREPTHPPLGNTLEEVTREPNVVAAVRHVVVAVVNVAIADVLADPAVVPDPDLVIDSEIDIEENLEIKW